MTGGRYSNSRWSVKNTNVRKQIKRSEKGCTFPYTQFRTMMFVGNALSIQSYTKTRSFDPHLTPRNP